MGLVNPEEIWEQIRLEKEIPKLVQEIISRYNLSTEEGIKAALRQAIWEGICKGKGWE